MMRSIVAVDRMLGLATEAGIPWDLPSDRRYFHEAIADGLILMGFGTYTEITAPLHGRTNYVATSKPGPLRDGFVTVPDAAAFADAHAAETVNNIGGAGLFAALLPVTDELLVTWIDADFGCVKFFPEFRDRFDLADESPRQRENGLEFTYQTWRPRRES